MYVAIFLATTASLSRAYHQSETEALLQINWPGLAHNIHPTIT